MTKEIKQVKDNKEKKIIRLSIPRNELMIIIVTNPEDVSQCQGGTNVVVQVSEINSYGENQSQSAVAAFQIVHVDGREERVVPLDWSIMYEHESDKPISVNDILDNKNRRKDRP